jgi:glycosyltransferase involved in cell wall biosynthesis
VNAANNSHGHAALGNGGLVQEPQTGLVSIIIACYNQAHFLHEAIQSALAQTYSDHEIIVVDDGSTDNTADAVKGYSAVRYLYQQNAGPSAARNAGVEHSRGEYLVFLDADDRLLPDALKIGVDCLHRHAHCAFASGFCRLIVADGSLLSQSEQPYVVQDHYVEMLRRNFIWCPGSVIYRRRAFEMVNGFNESLGRGEDYDLFLRLTRDYPVCCHKHFVADYRLHKATRSGDYSSMLRDTLSALDAQWESVKDSPHHVEALRTGKRYWRDRYETLQLAERIFAIAEATLPPDATVAVATGGRNELLKLGGRRAWHFPQADSIDRSRIFQRGTQGTVEIPWIEAGMRYEFHLFGGRDCARELAALSVTGVANGRSVIDMPSTPLRPPYLTASPNPVLACERFGRTMISWNTGDGSEGDIYLSRGGSYDSSIPQDDREAIGRLENVRSRGAQYLILPATAFWWLDRYESFRQYIQTKYPAIVRDNRCCVVFDLHRTVASADPVGAP